MPIFRRPFWAPLTRPSQPWIPGKLPEITAQAAIVEEDDRLSAAAAVAVQLSLGALATFANDGSAAGQITDHTFRPNTPSEGWGWVRSSIGRSSGKLFFQTTILGPGLPTFEMGIGSISDTGPLGNSSSSYTLYCRNSDGLVHTAHLGVASYGGTYVAGDVFGMLFDADAGTLTFYQNGVSLGVAFSGIPAGTYYAMIASPEIGSDVAIFNFGDSAFTFSQPADSILWSIEFREDDDTLSAAATLPVTASFNTLATFGPDHSPGMSISGKTIRSSVDGAASAKSTSPATSSRSLFWEITATEPQNEGGNIMGIGVAQTSFLNSQSVGINGIGCGYYSGGTAWISGSPQFYGAGFTDGDVIGVHLQFDASGIGSVTFYQNGVNLGVAASALPAGEYCAVVTTESAGCIATFNFGDSAFAFTQPAGSTPWANALAEEDDTASAAATVTVSLSSALTEDDDTLSATGAIAIAGAFAVTDEDDALSATCTTTGLVTAAFTITEEDDALSAVGSVAIAATADITDEGDIAGGAAAVALVLQSALTEDDDRILAVMTTNPVTPEVPSAPGFIQASLGSRGRIRTSIGPRRSS